MTKREFCQTAREGKLLWVTIDRPERMNALHPPANEELAAVFDEFAADGDAWVAILTGAGERAFCAGHDLRWQAEGKPFSVPASGYGGLTSRWDLDKPVIAAVNGVAMGGGFEIALACDLVIAAEHASFSLPEPRVGLAALAGGLQRLPRLIGEKRAMEMILTGRSVGAADGLRLGFVNDMVPRHELMNAARRWAEEIVACSPMSVRASKQALRRGLDEASLRAAYEAQFTYPAVRALRRSADAVEGPLAFAQKRTPNWSGR